MTDTSGKSTWTRLKDNWGARAAVALGLGATAVVGVVRPASADQVMCPPVPGPNASQEEKTNYANEKYMGCEDQTAVSSPTPMPAPIPWSVDKRGIVSISTYYSKHAVKVVDAINEDAGMRNIFESFGIGAVCDRLFPGTGLMCATSVLTIDVFKQLKADAFRDAAKEGTCVKETWNPVWQTLSWTTTSPDHSLCLE